MLPLFHWNIKIFYIFKLLKTSLHMLTPSKWDCLDISRPWCMRQLLTVIEPVCVDDADVMLGEGPHEDEWI